MITFKPSGGPDKRLRYDNDYRDNAAPIKVNVARCEGMRGTGVSLRGPGRVQQSSVNPSGD